MIKKWLYLATAAAMTLGVATTALANPPLPEKAATENISSIVQDIRNMYNQTNSGSYTRSGNQWINKTTYSDNVVKAVVTNGNAILDQAMQKNGYQQYTIEYYYSDSSFSTSRYFDSTSPYFAFAVIDGNEYRYYFYNNAMIRRIGPEGTVSDNPATNDFLNTIYQVGCIYNNDLTAISNRNLNQEAIYFGSSYYIFDSQVYVYGLTWNESASHEVNLYIIDANTQLSSNIRQEQTWRSGDNGYTWMKRFLTTDDYGGYSGGLECIQVTTTGSHIDSIHGIYATH